MRLVGNRFDPAGGLREFAVGLVLVLVMAAVMVLALAAVARSAPEPSAGARPNPPQGERRPRGPRIPEGTQVLRNLEYARADAKPLLLDLYLPAEAKRPLPLILWVHGGAWRAGSKDPCPAVGMVERGYAVASVGYRLSQEALFPAQIHDCKAAVRWLRAHAEKYHLDPKRFGAWGSSAGGHLVALLGTSGGVADLDGNLGNPDQSSRVQAVCDWFGPTDFCRMSEGESAMDHDAANAPESQLIGGPVQQNKDKAARANPITYVTKDDPPFLIMHGDRDRTVPPNQSQLLHAALQTAGVETTLYMVAGAGHGGFGADAQQMVYDFFDKHLKVPPAGASAPAGGQ